MTNEILDYMTEQYQDIVDAQKESGSEYLEGIVDAYEHIITKFGSYEAS